MLNENLKAARKQKGLSQEELALRLHVVRQTLSKWERGLSVPDADLLLRISEALETPVSALLGETLPKGEETPPETASLEALAQELERINLAFARRKALRRKEVHWLLIAVCGGVAAVFAALVLVWHSPYLSWDYSDPETAVMGVGLHALEWVFVRLGPVLFIGAALGAFLTRERR